MKKYTLNEIIAKAQQLAKRTTIISNALAILDFIVAYSMFLVTKEPCDYITAIESYKRIDTSWASSNENNVLTYREYKDFLVEIEATQPYYVCSMIKNPDHDGVGTPYTIIDAVIKSTVFENDVEAREECGKLNSAQCTIVFDTKSLMDVYYHEKAEMEKNAKKELA